MALVRVAVVYHCTVNYHKLSDLEQHKLHILFSVDEESGDGLAGSFTQAYIKAQAGAMIISEALGSLSRS